MSFFPDDGVVNEPVKGNGNTENRNNQKERSIFIAKSLSSQTNNNTRDNNARDNRAEVESSELFDKFTPPNKFFVFEGPKIIKNKVADYRNFGG